MDLAAQEQHGHMRTSLNKAMGSGWTRLVRSGKRMVDWRAIVVGDEVQSWDCDLVSEECGPCEWLGLARSSVRQCCDERIAHLAEVCCTIKERVSEEWDEIWKAGLKTLCSWRISGVELWPAVQIPGKCVTDWNNHYLIDPGNRDLGRERSTDGTKSSQFAQQHIQENEGCCEENELPGDLVTIWFHHLDWRRFDKSPVFRWKACGTCGNA